MEDNGLDLRQRVRELEALAHENQWNIARLNQWREIEEARRSRTPGLAVAIIAVSVSIVGIFANLVIAWVF